MNVTDHRKKQEAVFTVPMIYPSLNVILAMHHYPRQRLHDEFVHKAGLVIKTAKIKPFPGMVRIYMDLCFQTKRKVRRDIDNYSPKWLLDAIRSAGVIVDDNSDIVPEPVSIQFYDCEPAAQVVVKIVEI